MLILTKNGKPIAFLFLENLIFEKDTNFFKNGYPLAVLFSVKIGYFEKILILVKWPAHLAFP